jgi:hypothetical protein
MAAKVRPRLTPLAGGPLGERILRMYIIQAFAVGSFALNSVLLAEDSNLRDLGIIVLITEDL